MKSFWVYSVALAVAWAIVLVAGFAARGAAAVPLVYVFAGFALGWTSTTIARYVYPPPAKWHPTPRS